ncbi:hypothetical protein GW17_00007293 [Ensete ventricosum]|nr:hypothetical protein GW17_00007293 [Ensete ventricosum]
MVRPKFRPQSWLKSSKCTRIPKTMTSEFVRITDLGGPNGAYSDTASHFEDEIPPEDKPGLPIRSLPTEGLEARGGRDLVVPVQHFSPHNLLHRGRRRGERRRRTHRDQPNPIRNNSRKNRVRSGRRWLGFEEGETGRRVIRKKSKGIIVYMELIVQPTGDLTN